MSCLLCIHAHTKVDVYSLSSLPKESSTRSCGRHPEVLPEMPHHKPQSYSTPANNPSIQPLSTSIISQIRSTINIVSPSCVLRELVQNSIDAKASRVDIWVMEEGQKLMVVDDGEGVGKEDIKSLGGRYGESSQERDDLPRAVANHRKL